MWKKNPSWVFFVLVALKNGSRFLLRFYLDEHVPLFGEIKMFLFCAVLVNWNKMKWYVDLNSPNVPKQSENWNHFDKFCPTSSVEMIWVKPRRVTLNILSSSNCVVFLHLTYVWLLSDLLSLKDGPGYHYVWWRSVWITIRNCDGRDVVGLVRCVCLFCLNFRWRRGIILFLSLYFNFYIYLTLIRLFGWYR